MQPSPEPVAVGVILAAGMGTRVGADGNKAYLPLAGRSMVSWSVAAVAGSPRIGRVILVFRSGERELAARTLAAELPRRQSNSSKAATPGTAPRRTSCASWHPTSTAAPSTRC